MNWPKESSKCQAQTESIYWQALIFLLPSKCGRRGWFSPFTCTFTLQAYIICTQKNIYTQKKKICFLQVRWLRKEGKQLAGMHKICPPKRFLAHGCTSHSLELDVVKAVGYWQWKKPTTRGPIWRVAYSPRSWRNAPWCCLQCNAAFNFISTLLLMAFASRQLLGIQPTHLELGPLCIFTHSASLGMGHLLLVKRDASRRKL